MSADPTDPTPSAYGEDWPPAPAVDSSTLTPDTDFNIRCKKCAKLLIEFATRPYSVRCPRCKSVRVSLPRP